MWTIGPYRLDPASFALSRDGEPIELQRRPLDLLLYLIAHRGTVVTREELLAEVWGGLAVSEGALRTAVYEARTALGDLERAPRERWIETVRGRGFRFRGPAKRITEAVAARESAPFVGRRALLRELAGDIGRLSSGGGAIRVIEGVAGMGKTRLVQKATQEPSAAKVHTVYCERGAPPFWPWMQLVRGLER
jgi:DNA-binding winged helix-turn-helix (wHTH) protein